MPGTDVDTAFLILLDKLDNACNALLRVGVSALQSADSDEAEDAIERAKRLVELGQKVLGLQREYKCIVKAACRVPTKPYRQAKRGLGTPSNAYRLPLLKVLFGLGGRATARQAIDAVGVEMRDVLNEHDMETLNSTPEDPRWEKMLQWCKYHLKKEGLIKGDSPRGIWEISEKGVNALKSGSFNETETD